MPKRWLVKTEPESYSFADLVRDRKTRWDGVRNPVAANHLRAMQPGDEVLVYHTGKEKSVVGVARVAKPPYADPTADGGNWVAVDLEAVRPLDAPVALADLRKETACRDFALVRVPRLSVMPVPDEAWTVVDRRSKKTA
jgi:predicted RNA-binding protein with PUA-like domain